MDDSAKVLICELKEQQQHVHSEACYEAKPVLICDGEAKQVHTHEEGCYEVHPGHQHGADCRDENGELIYTMEETEETEPQLSCTLEEGLTHTHSERCYGTWELVCLQMAWKRN